MSEKQVKRDLEELNLGIDTKQLVAEYYKKKKKEMLILFLAGIFLFFLLFITRQKELNLEEGNKILRNQGAVGKKEVSLMVRREGKEWENLQLPVEGKEYTKEELEKQYKEIIRVLPQYILGKNQDLDHIVSDLAFVQEIQGYPFYLTWESTDKNLISNTGIIQQKVRKETSPVELRVKIKYKEWEREHSFFVVLEKTKVPRYMISLLEHIEEKESSTRTEDILYLPDNFQGENLEWKYQGRNQGYLVLFLLFPALFLIWHQKDRELNKQAEERRQQLARQYPAFVSRLALYMGTGISARESIIRIQKEYSQGRKGEKDYLQDELTYLVTQMKNGLSEQKAYEMLGSRCGISSYKKLSALLVQQIYKGNYKLLEQLKKEIDDANEEQYRKIKKRGEEMGTKLLFPMMLLLGIVMALIMIPAFTSFQF